MCCVVGFEAKGELIVRYLLVNALHWRSAEKENPFSDSFDLPLLPQNTAGLDLKCIKSHPKMCPKPDPPNYLGVFLH